MRRKDIIWISAALLTLTGCSSDEDMKSQADGLVPISLTTAMDGEHQAATRAGTAIQSTQFDASETFYAYFASGARIGDSNSPCSTTYTYTGSPAAGATTPAGQPYFAATATEAVVHAYYPYVTGKQVTNETTSFSVEQDQTDATGYKKSDLMYATETIDKTSPSATLTFSHMMSKIIVSATAGTDVSTITDVRIVGGNKTINIVNPTTTNESTTPFFGTTPTYDNALSTTSYISMYTSGTAATAECAALLPPQTITNTDAFLEIVTNRGSAFYKLATTFASGYSYTFNLTINAASIGLTTTINDWEVGVGPTGNTLLDSKFTVNAEIYGAQEYTGTAYTPAVSVSLNGVALTLGTHYTLHFINNDIPGTATILAYGIGDYAGISGNTHFTITPKTIANATNSNLGWVITGDGYIYHNCEAAERSNKIPVAVIGYVGSAGNADASNSTYRGLAIALSDAGNGAGWYGTHGATSDTWSSTCVYRSDVLSNHYNYCDMSGIANTNQMANKTGNCATHTSHAAATAAKNYSSTVTGCSQWFLPSSGQWLRFLCGGINLTWSTVNWGQYNSTGAAGFSAVNKLFTDAGAIGAVFADGTCYWASSEYSLTSSVCLLFSSSYGISINGSSKFAAYKIRPFLAF